jgi:hypothetical protein
MKNSLTGSLILFSVATGVAFTALISDASKSVEVMNILFLGFAGAIVAVQLAPSYMMLRRIFGNMLNLPGREMKRNLKP